jgi:hypothetical protein
VFLGAAWTQCPCQCMGGLAWLLHRLTPSSISLSLSLDSSWIETVYALAREESLELA